ncbi:MAG: hypothetical protein QXD21_03505 [Thermoproteota archaeon]
MRFEKRIRILTFLMLTLLLATYSSLHNLTIIVSGQEAASIIVTTEGTRINVSAQDEEGGEVYSLILENNGGIREIRVLAKRAASLSGNFLWNDDWDQVWSTTLENPVIEEKAKYVKIITSSIYKKHPVSMLTEIKATKLGLVFINTTMKAEENCPDVVATGWVLKLPVDLFIDVKVYFKEGEEIKYVTLPSTPPSKGGIYSSSKIPLWVDISFPSYGITMINLDPSSHVEFLIEDWRPYNVQVFTVMFRHTPWQQGAMSKGVVRKSTLAFYMHGAGGYEGAMDTINLVTDIRTVRSDAENMVKTSKIPDAKTLASQALSKANDALYKLSEGELEDAKSNLNEAKSLLEQARSKEEAALSSLEKDINDVKAKAENAVATYISSKARDLASQALNKANSAKSKFQTGDLEGAASDLSTAKELLARAEEIEQTVRNLETEINTIRTRAQESLSKYESNRAKELANQALEKVNSADSKFKAGNLDGAQEDLQSAKSLLDQADEVEKVYANLLSEINRVENSAKTAYESYVGTKSKEMVSQALDKAKAAKNKLSEGDFEGAQSDLNQAKSLLNQAENIENSIKNILPEIQNIRNQAQNALNTYTGSRAKDLASQARNRAESAYQKAMNGDISGAQSDLNQAKSLLDQAKTAEEEEARTRTMLTIGVAAVVVVIIAIVALLMIRRRRKPA